MITRQLKTYIYALFLLSALVLVSQAQNLVPAEDSGGSFDDEDIYTLSPFEVTSDSDVGYLATSTLAGTRIRTDLRDVGSAISVVTEEMLNDVGATDNSTLLQYTTNAEVAGTRGTYAGLDNGENLDETTNLRSPTSAQRVRGLAAADNTRDFFVTDIPWDSYIASRIDIQRGANSILFGLGSPAGIVNAAIDSAEFYDSGEVSVRVGSYGSLRGSVDVNRVLFDDVLAVRVEGLWDHEKFRQDPAFEDDERTFAAIRFEPKWFGEGNRTTFKANYENGSIDANRPRIIPPNDSISAWFRPMPTDGNWTMNSGMGKTPVINTYDANRTEVDPDDNGNGGWSYPEGNPYYGMNVTGTDNYQPWLGTIVNQQQPIYFIDGQSGTTSKIMAGYMNVGAYSPTGNLRSATAGVMGRQYSEQFFRLKDFSAYASQVGLPLAGSGQYRWETMMDDSIFDFYNKLIDGPNKWEKEDWETYNLDLTQSFFHDRVAVNLTYDRQRYERASESLLGGSPTITMDILMNLQDYYATGADGETSISNPNYGRPYVETSTGETGGSYKSDRESVRASVFAEFRVDDVTDNDLLTKIFGKHNFNAVVARDRFHSESRSWYPVANSLAWTAFWNGNTGTTTTFYERTAKGAIYLGSSVADRASASGANIPNIGAEVYMGDGQAYIWDATWKNFYADPGAPWDVPEKLQRIYNTVPGDNDFFGEDGDPYWTQASNPDNYVGWSYKDFSLLHYNNGEHLELTSKAQKALRKVESKAFSWQGFFWNDALVTTFGWRNDRVKDKDVQAQKQPNNRSYLDLSEDVYKLPDEFPALQTFESDSRSYAAVLHLNRILENDPLPINVSVSYNQSENFQITSTRRDLLGNVLTNPSGETKDWGILLSTKDNKYSLRLVKYKTTVVNASSNMSNTGNIGATIQDGLKWRNIFLYDLGAYDWDTREDTSANYRHTWTNAYPDLSDEEAQAEEDASIRGWNEIQAYMQEIGFFDAWGFNPTPLQYLTDRSTYEATLVGRDPAPEYTPPAGYVVAYGATAPQGFTVTEDTESKGYELEVTANPLPNWRISFNASKTEATRQNVGNQNLADWITYMDSVFLDANGNMTPAAKMPRWGGAGNAIYPAIYQKFIGSYSQLKLKEGASTPEVRKWRFNVVTNYTFIDGVLEGLGVGGSYRWQDKVGIGYPVTEEGMSYSFDLDNPVMGPSEDAIDLWCSYERAITDKIDWKIQLNIRNAFAGDDLIPISIQADGKTIASARIAPTQEWFITNTFSF